MKKIVFIILLISPIVVFAQVSGGEIRRSVKTNTQSNSTPARTNSSSDDNSKPAVNRSNRDAILQNLINNMVHVVGGTFTMGATPEQGSDNYSSDKPTHEVFLSSFSIGKYEVTQREWEAVMGSNHSDFKNPDFPVDNISYNDCLEFINKLNSITNRRFRLPTEAEWEYAARGGNSIISYKFAGSDHMDEVAWNKNNSNGTTHKVGSKKPNALGLYDMSGNVWEWCSDWFSQYEDKKQANPKGPSTGKSKVIRGGAWEYGEWHLHVSFRQGMIPSNSSNILGLRLAEDL